MWAGYLGLENVLSLSSQIRRRPSKQQKSQQPWQEIFFLCNSLLIASLQQCLDFLRPEGLLPSFDQHSPSPYIKVIQRYPCEGEHSNPKNKGEENVQFSHEIRKHTFKGIKTELWHATMMMLHMAHCGRYLVFLVQHMHLFLANFQEDNTMIENQVGQKLGSSDQS